MATTEWTHDDWSKLVKRIVQQKVTPVMGAGVSSDVVGAARDLATAWAQEVHYPFDDNWSLPAVAQYVATTGDRSEPGEYIEARVGGLISNLVIPDLGDAYHPYRFLPRRQFPIWLTTNYDDLIERGLNAANKPPRVSTATWVPPNLVWDTRRYELGDFAPSERHPLVFHLHGVYDDVASMVITETDYLEYLEQLRNLSEVLPAVVQNALASTSLLFIGYSFRDVNLQLILRTWNLPRLAYLVRPLPDGLSDEQIQAFTDYYPRYLKSVTRADFKVFWGTASSFCKEFSHRLKDGGS